MCQLNGFSFDTKAKQYVTIIIQFQNFIIIKTFRLTKFSNIFVCCVELSGSPTKKKYK